MKLCFFPISFFRLLFVCVCVCVCVCESRAGVDIYIEFYKNTTHLFTLCLSSLSNDRVEWLLHKTLVFQI